MLNISQKAAMREILTKIMDTPVQVERASLVSTPDGGTKKLYSPIETTTCYLSDDGIKDIEIGGQIRPLRNWICALPYGTVIENQDRLVIGDLVLTVVALNIGETFELETRVRAVEL